MPITFCSLHLPFHQFRTHETERIEQIVVESSRYNRMINLNNNE